jgi:hypothetical protein
MNIQYLQKKSCNFDFSKIIINKTILIKLIYNNLLKKNSIPIVTYIFGHEDWNSECGISIARIILKDM